MEVDAVRQENPGSMQMSTSSKNGLNQVIFELHFQIIRKSISVIVEPTFLILTNPVRKYHPIQVNFLGKNIDQESL